MAQISKKTPSHKATNVKPLTPPKPKHNLLGKATELAKVLKSKDTIEANRIMAMKGNIDILKIEKAIARYRRAIVLQSHLLDELEAEVKEIKRDSRKKKPALRQTHKRR